MQSVRIVIQVYNDNDTNPKWRTIKSSILNEDSTPEIISDTVENIEARINTYLGRF